MGLSGTFTGRSLGGRTSSRGSYGNRPPVNTGGVKVPSTGSFAKVPGWTYSSFDKAYHPPSWYATKTTVQPPAAAPPKQAEKPKPVLKLSSIDNKMHPPSWWSSGGPAKAAAEKAKIAKKAPATGFVHAVHPTNKQSAAQATRHNAIRQGMLDKNKGAINKAKATFLRGVAANYNAKARARAGGGTNSSSVNRGGGSTVPVRPAAPTTPPVKKAAPPAKPVTPPPKKIAPPVKKAAPRSRVLEGKGRASRFGNRRRTGPRSGLSMTPEMLQAMARQRIVNYH